MLSTYVNPTIELHILTKNHIFGDPPRQAWQISTRAPSESCKNNPDITSRITTPWTELKKGKKTEIPRPLCKGVRCKELLEYKRVGSVQNPRWATWTRNSPDDVLFGFLQLRFIRAICPLLPRGCSKTKPRDDIFFLLNFLPYPEIDLGKAFLI